MQPEVLAMLKSKMRDKAFADWTPVCETVSESSALVRVYRDNHGGYYVLRAFMIGIMPEVSYDLYDGSPERLAFELCRVLGEMDTAIYMEEEA
jgi:hypothetical protein